MRTTIPALACVILAAAFGAASTTDIWMTAAAEDFARGKLEAVLPAGSAPLILLQHSDNRPWVEEVAAREVRARLPRASVLVRPLSLTSGAHMGPGTWAVAFLPEAFNAPVSRI